MSRKTVAILGASAERSKYGNQSLRAHLKQGYVVYPVNPKGGEILGKQAYQSVSDVPGEVDFAICAIAAKFVPDTLKQCGRRFRRGEGVPWRHGGDV